MLVRGAKRRPQPDRVGLSVEEPLIQRQHMIGAEEEEQILQCLSKPEALHDIVMTGWHHSHVLHQQHKQPSVPCWKEPRNELDTPCPSACAQQYKSHVHVVTCPAARDHRTALTHGKIAHPKSNLHITANLHMLWQNCWYRMVPWQNCMAQLHRQASLGCDTRSCFARHIVNAWQHDNAEHEQWADTWARKEKDVAQMWLWGGPGL